MPYKINILTQDLLNIPTYGEIYLIIKKALVG